MPGYEYLLQPRKPHTAHSSIPQQQKQKTWLRRQWTCCPDTEMYVCANISMCASRLTHYIVLCVQEFRSREYWDKFFQERSQAFEWCVHPRAYAVPLLLLH